MNDVKIIIQFNGKQMTLPVNPAKLSISRTASNTNIDILGVGKATRKGEPGLITTKIESFFPCANSPFYTGKKPMTCINFINDIWNAENINNNVARLITVGLEKNINIRFVIESFNYDYNAGDDDVNYTLNIKEYRHYGVQYVSDELSGMDSSRAASPAVEQSDIPQNENNYYTVESGDCLWNIAKACCGDGSRYKEIYELNKDILGANPNYILPGQKLVLPTGWSTPTKVTKLQSVSKTQTQQNTVKQHEYHNHSNTASNTATDDQKAAARTLATGTVIGSTRTLPKLGTEAGDSSLPIGAIDRW